MAIIVTSGLEFLDIDGYASCVSYAELLRAQGKGAIAASHGVMNASIPPSLRELKVDFLQRYKPKESDRFVIVDVSKPHHLDSMVDIERVNEIIDHHPGFEDFWRQRLGGDAWIEKIGAVATQIYEKWQQADMLQDMPKECATLLAAGIQDNTLNLNADITTERDKDAYQSLLEIGHEADDFARRYFHECQIYLTTNLDGSLRNDTKVMSLGRFSKDVTIGQLVVWDGRELVNSGIHLLKTMQSGHPKLLNIISVHERCNYLICEDPELQVFLSDILSAKFDDRVARTDRLWLRKEILRRSIEFDT